MIVPELTLDYIRLFLCMHALKTEVPNVSILLSKEVISPDIV